eukprot:3512568-Pleurochrysis_carterae.AAC.1
MRRCRQKKVAEAEPDCGVVRRAGAGDRAPGRAGSRYGREQERVTDAGRALVETELRPGVETDPDAAEGAEGSSLKWKGFAFAGSVGELNAGGARGEGGVGEGGWQERRRAGGSDRGCERGSEGRKRMA